MMEYRDSNQSGLQTGLIEIADRDWDLACNFLWEEYHCVRLAIVMALVVQASGTKWFVPVCHLV
jgi:hypothetical protein